MEEKWTVFSLNLGVLPQTPDTMSFPSREAALEHACSLPPRVKNPHIEDTEGQRVQAEEVEKLCRIELLLRKYRTEQQFSRFEWSENPEICYQVRKNPTQLCGIGGQS